MSAYVVFVSTIERQCVCVRSMSEKERERGMCARVAHRLILCV